MIDKDVADGVNKLLKSVVDKGTGTPGPDLPAVDDQAGKTGTIDSNEAVWFAGYTPEIAGGAMISIDNTRAVLQGQAKALPAQRLNGYRVHRPTFSRAPAAATPD